MLKKLKKQFKTMYNKIRGDIVNGLSILMLIFSVSIFLAGLYIYTGHDSSVLLWKVHYSRKLTNEELKNIGKWTMITSVIPLIIAVIGFFLDI